MWKVCHIKVLSKLTSEATSLIIGLLVIIPISLVLILNLPQGAYAKETSSLDSENIFVSSSLKKLQQSQPETKRILIVRLKKTFQVSSLKSSTVTSYSQWSKQAVNSSYIKTAKSTLQDYGELYEGKCRYAYRGQERKCNNTYFLFLNAIRLKAPISNVNDIASLPRVKAVWDGEIQLETMNKDYASKPSPLSAPDSHPYDWGSLNENSTEFTSMGGPVFTSSIENRDTSWPLNISVISKGFDKQHPLTNDIISEGTSGWEKWMVNIDKAFYYLDDLDYWDGGSHATGVLGAVWRFAPHALYRVHELPPLVLLGEFVDAIEKAKDWGAEIITTSLGKGVGRKSGIQNQELCTTVNEASDESTIFIAAAGNKGGGTKYPAEPSAASEAISVSSTNEDNSIIFPANSPEYSNNGKPDLAAPGGGIDTLSPDSDENYTQVTGGSSFAAPLVAGAAALLMQETDSYDDAGSIRTALKESAIDIEGTSLDGDGRVLVDGAYAYIMGDDVYPDPFVKIQDVSSEDSRIELSVSLQNEGSSSEKGGGVHLRVENGHFLLANTGDFDQVQGYDKEGKETDVKGASTVEFLIDDGEEADSGVIKIQIENEDQEVNIHKRGWVLDSFDRAYDKYEEKYELYTARYPDEHPQLEEGEVGTSNNPPFNRHYYDDTFSFLDYETDIRSFGPPELCISPDPADHDFGKLSKGETDSWTFTVKNCGDQTLDWNASDNKGWISLSPTSGSLDGGNSQQVTVGVDTSGLSFGSHTGDLNITNGTTKDGDISLYVNKPSQVEAISYNVDDDNNGSSSGDDDGEAEPGESIELDVTLKNTGNVTAENVQATLGTSDSRVNITDEEMNFGDISAGGTKQPADFDFDVDNDANPGPVDFNLDITYDDGPSSDTLTVEIYGQETGSIKVTLEPSGARHDGAKWRVKDSNDNWHEWFDSGHKETGLPTGPYTVEYKDISGWDGPSNDTGNIEEGQLITESGTYTDSGKPALISDFNASDGENGKSTLKWTNPSDSDLTEVVVRRKIRSYPKDYNDGTTVYSDDSPNPGGSITKTDRGLVNGDSYYYAVFSKIGTGNWNERVVESKNADTGNPKGNINGLEAFLDQGVDNGTIPKGGSKVIQTQRIKFADDDQNMNQVKLDRITIDNMGTATGPDIYRLRVELEANRLRRPLTVRIPVHRFPLTWTLPDNAILPDDTNGTIELGVTVAKRAVGGHTIKLKVNVDHHEVPYFASVTRSTADFVDAVTRSTTDGVAEIIKKEPIKFPDSNLEQAIRDAIGKQSGGIYPSDLEGLTDLAARDMGIEDLTGIEHCTTLEGLFLQENNISNISPLSDLTELEELLLNVNDISDITPLSNLTKIKELWLGNNNISTISPLVDNSGLGNGDKIDLERNHLDLSEGSKDMEDIQTLIDKGVEVKYEPQTTTHPIPYVVSRWVDGALNPDDDPTISTDQILQAIAWWADNTQVPQTGGEIISTDTVLNLISFWADGMPVGE